VLDARLGQNGFLSGALIGLFLLALRAGRDSAGVPLGLMVFKPHMGVVIGLLALLKGRFRLLALGVAVVVGTCLAATAMLGVAVWPAFLEGAQAGVFLKQGAFPLYRMSSIYAGLRSFDLSPDMAMAGHALGAGGDCPGGVGASRQMADAPADGAGGGDDAFRQPLQLRL
jgi:hypothetical protein